MPVDRRRSGSYFYAYAGNRRSKTSIRKYLGSGIIGEYIHSLAVEQRNERRRAAERESKAKREISSAVSFTRQAVKIAVDATASENGQAGLLSPWIEALFAVAASSPQIRTRPLQDANGAISMKSKPMLHPLSMHWLKFRRQLVLGSCWWKEPALPKFFPRSGLTTGVRSWAEAKLWHSKSFALNAHSCRLEVEVVAAMALAGRFSTEHATFLVQRCHAGRQRLSAAIQMRTAVRRALARHKDIAFGSVDHYASTFRERRLVAPNKSRSSFARGS